MRYMNENIAKAIELIKKDQVENFGDNVFNR